jgi:hypothetical protein
MKKCLGKIGTIGGYVGAIVCIVAVIGRFHSLVTIQGYNAKSILICGIGIGVFACWAKLEAASTKD